MKRIFLLTCFALLSCSAVSVFAQTKVVVIPLGGSESPGIQHYRISSQTGTSENGCETVSFATNGAEIEAVFSSNFSIQPTANDPMWFSAVQYTTDNGAIWNYVSLQLTVSGTTSGISSQTSTSELLTMSPNSNYKFRINTLDMPTVSGGQCELLITFNKKEATNIVTPAAVFPVVPATGIGAVNNE